MAVTPFTWVICITGITLMGLLMAAQSIALVRPRSAWTVANECKVKARY